MSYLSRCVASHGCCTTGLIAVQDVGLHGACPPNVSCVLKSVYIWDVAGQKIVYLLLTVCCYEQGCGGAAVIRLIRLCGVAVLWLCASVSCAQIPVWFAVLMIIEYRKSSAGSKDGFASYTAAGARQLYMH